MGRCVGAYVCVKGLGWHVSRSLQGVARWNLTLAVADVLTSGKAVATGVLGAPVAPGSWHTLRLRVSSTAAAGFVDGASVFSAVDVSSAPARGWVGFGTPRFGDFTQFDRVTVNATAWRCSEAGSAGSPVALWPCDSSSPGQAWTFLPLSISGSDSAWGVLSLRALPTPLCLAVSNARNAYGSPNVIVDVCNASSALQQFQLQSGGAIQTRGPPSGNSSLTCLDVTADSYTIGQQLDTYNCSGDLNQKWKVRSLAGQGTAVVLSSGDPSDFYCAGACAEL